MKASVGLAVWRILSASDSETLRSSSILPAKLATRNSMGPQVEEPRNIQKIAEELPLIAQRFSR